MKTLFYLLSAAVLLVSCEKNALQLPIDPVTTGARIKLVHAAPDAPAVDLFLNGKKFSAFTPTGVTSTFAGNPVGVPYNNTFPGNGANYAVAPAESSEVRISAPASTSAGSATVITTQNLAFEDNKYYSLIVTGTGPQPELLVLSDDFSAATDPTKYYVRFVNLTAGQNYDLAVGTNATLAQNLAYKGTTAFIAVDANTSPVFAFRLPGSITNVSTVTFTGSTSGRVVTAFIRGVAGRTGTAAPGINFYVNR